MSMVWKRFVSTRLFTFAWKSLMMLLDKSLPLKLAFYQIVWRLPDSLRPVSALRFALRKVALRQKDVFVVHIGANDGLSDDSLAEFIIRANWKGILVEPVPGVFQRLRHIYRHVQGVELRNVAISDKDGQQSFWLLDPAARLPRVFDTIGSFDREHVVRYLTNEGKPELLRYLTSCDVRTTTVSSLLAPRRGQQVDVLSIDAEGYDAKILGQFDFSSFHPSVVVYESMNLPPSEQVTCMDILRKNGYHVVEQNGNTLACSNPDDIEMYRVHNGTTA